MSILDFPDRGPWGKASWPGNCSGHVYRELYERLRPRLTVDVMAGSMTAVDVARDMGVEAYGLDLHSGFNVLRDSILATIGRPACLVTSHPPYGQAIRYSGHVWGDAEHPDDLSHCQSDEEFCHKLHIALLNQRDATRAGGHYATIIGDYRRDGKYTSYQAAAIGLMPASELVAVLIKTQHATRSSRRQYRPMTWPMITHEFVLVWQKQACTTYHLLGTLARSHGERLQGTWRAVIRTVMINLGGRATLDAVYAAVAAGCPERVTRNASWKAKVRQVLNSTGEYVATRRGEWSLP